MHGRDFSNGPNQQTGGRTHETDNEAHDERVPRRIRLKIRFVGKDAAVKALCDKTLAEADVRAA